MARKPFFSGNYGSALARVDTRPIIEAGRAQGQMYANMGQQIGGMIQQYGLNKEKRAKLTGEIEAHYEQNKDALAQIGMSGDEAQDKKDFTEREKFVKGDMSMAQLEGYAGKLARGEVLKTKDLDNRYKRATIEGAEFKNKFNLANAENELLKGDLANRTASQVIDLNNLRSEGTRLDNELKKLNTVSKGTENDYQLTLIKQKLEQNRQSIISTEEGIKKQITDNRYAVPMYESQLLQKRLEVSEIAQRMEKSAMEMDQIRADETLDRSIKEERLAGMQADREKIESELKIATQSAENLAKLLQGTDA